jgi:hypothetical protein
MLRILKCKIWVEMMIIIHLFKYTFKKYTFLSNCKKYNKIARIYFYKIIITLNEIIININTNNILKN